MFFLCVAPPDRVRVDFAAVASGARGVPFGGFGVGLRVAFPGGRSVATRSDRSDNRDESDAWV